MVVNKVDSIHQVTLEHIKPHPKNPNKHSDEQIERLCKIIKYQGFRNPLIISKRSGFLIAGHGRLEAAKKLGLKTVPCSYQDFESDEQEYAAMTADNAVASWAELDLSAINAELPELGPDFQIDYLGIEGFLLDPPGQLTNAGEYKTASEKLEAFLGHETRKIIIAYSGEAYLKNTKALERLCTDKNLKDYSEAVELLLDEYCANN